MNEPLPMGVEFHKPITERCPVVDQGIDIARLFPDGQDKETFVKIVAQMWRTYANVVYLVDPK